MIDSQFWSAILGILAAILTIVASSVTLVRYRRRSSVKSDGEGASSSTLPGLSLGSRKAILPASTAQRVNKRDQISA